ncbi:MAG: hypothetical protein U9Q88_01535 [Bacillota bacterium]|nr:hypothetical protein [Bacillota bacterium]
MLQAELNGKIPSSLINSEDLLTSSVFGTIRYFSSPAFINNIIKQAINMQGENVDIDILPDSLQYHFWPRLENCEPDLIISIQDFSKKVYLICIEAKYFSGKSSYENETLELEERHNYHRDQLAREFEDLCRESTLGILSIKQDSMVKPLLIYLTNDSYMPTKELMESYKAIRQPNVNLTDLYWLSWKSIYNVLQRSVAKTVQDTILLNDLMDLFIRKNLASFGGFTDLKDVVYSDWVYTSNLMEVKWGSIKKLENLSWTYRGKQYENK